MIHDTDALVNAVEILGPKDRRALGSAGNRVGQLWRQGEMEDIATKAVDEILADLTDRRGLRQEWENIDPEIQDEIRATWIGIIEDLAAA